MPKKTPAQLIADARADLEALSAVAAADWKVLRLHDLEFVARVLGSLRKLARVPAAQPGPPGSVERGGGSEAQSASDAWPTETGHSHAAS